PDHYKIIVITKKQPKDSDSFLAQGGISVLRDNDDYDAYFEDTLKAGRYKNNKYSVEILIRSSRSVIEDLVRLGVNFDQDGSD
ncbi:MAG TPA: L-aspartate oxidase, partial [Clostridium sp.]|nr:L-aspartate oxidase [Clostridium sp.]